MYGEDYEEINELESDFENYIDDGDLEEAKESKSDNDDKSDDKERAIGQKTSKPAVNQLDSPKRKRKDSDDA